MKSLLYLVLFIFVVLIVIGNSVALIIFFSGILALCIYHAIAEKLESKRK